MLVCLVPFLTWWYTSEKWPRSRKTWLGTSWLGSTQWVSSTAVFSSNTFKNICKMAGMGWIWGFEYLIWNVCFWILGPQTYGWVLLPLGALKALTPSKEGWGRAPKGDPALSVPSVALGVAVQKIFSWHVHNYTGKQGSREITPTVFFASDWFLPQKSELPELRFFIFTVIFCTLISLCWWICKSIFVQVFWGDWS